MLLFAISTGLLIAGIISSLVGAGAGIGSAIMGKKAQEKANETNQQIAQQETAASAEMAQKQMDFQREMSNTAHQREVADLQAAGLNPILSATGGTGAMVPSGASGDVSSARVKAASLDLSGITTAMNSLNNLMITGMILDARRGGSAKSSLYQEKNPRFVKMMKDVLKNSED